MKEHGRVRKSKERNKKTTLNEIKIDIFSNCCWMRCSKKCHCKEFLEEPRRLTRSWNIINWLQVNNSEHFEQVQLGSLCTHCLFKHNAEFFAVVKHHFACHDASNACFYSEIHASLEIDIGKPG